jgi:magnesium chelatase family protein
VPVEIAKARGMSLYGVGAELVTVEARFEGTERGRTEIVLSGLPDPVIRESRGKLLCALLENGLSLGQGRLYLNLLPAGLRKAGEGLDLPLVLAAAAAGGHLAAGWLEDCLFLGEVGIDGSLHPVPGGLAAAELAARSGLKRLVAPPETAAEACHLPGVAVHPARHVAEVIGLVSGARPWPVPLAVRLKAPRGGGALRWITSAGRRSANGP